MKIFSITPINIITVQSQQTQTNKTASVARSNVSVPLLQTPLSQDTCSFTGKIPSIVKPTMEDLVNRTKAVDILRFNVLRLAKHKVPCPCCGHIMLDVDTFNAFESKAMQTTDPGELLKLVGGLKTYLHPVESRVFSMMKNMHEKNPQRSLHDMLCSKLKTSEERIINQQSKVLNAIGILSKKLPEDKSKQVKELIGETYERLFDKRKTSRFGRRVFIAKLSEIIDNIENQKLKSKLIETSAQLPAAYNNIDAFIVKYAKRNYEGNNPDQKIAIRMLSNSLATVEHIRPRKLRGATSPDNLALECAADNNRRGHASVIEQILQNPEMLINYNRYMNRLVELHRAKKLEKSYITQTNKTYREESEGLLDADLVSLSYNGQSRKFKVKDGRTLSKAERRAARKDHIKDKKLRKKHCFGHKYQLSDKCNSRFRRNK